MDMTNVTVLGTGVLGSQIAFKAADAGFPVVAYDISDEVLEVAAKRFASLAQRYVADLPDVTEERSQAALARLTLTSDLAVAARDADIVIEAAPEKIEIKRVLFERLAASAPERTIFATNSSTLLPSDIAPFTGRPEKFLALHFANDIHIHNTAEVMGTTETDPAVFDWVVQFASDIGAEPIKILKEKAGYVLNSLLVPFLAAAAELYVDGIASTEDIDKNWRISTGAPKGPFQIYDIVGLVTPYNIMAHSPNPKLQEFARILKTEFIDQGKLGVATGQGFYTYADQA